MEPLGGLAPLSDAATAAASRAGDCRRRVDDLRSGSPAIGSADVVRARDRLAEARARAEAARLRLDETRRFREAQQLLRRFSAPHAPRTVRAPKDVDDGGLAPLRLKAFEWVSTGRVGLKPLWLEFVALGGECGLLEFDAFLHHAWLMSPRDLGVLDQVCWEYETFGTI